ncbi:MAG: GAF domain-containing protein [Calditrichaeota bacterium]|nr:MAG: GAF domain-containing protein [Calditrichota bacterium]
MNDVKLQKLEEENKTLRGAVAELSILNDIATAMSSTLSLAAIMELIVNKCVKHLAVEQVAIMLLDEKGQDEPMHTMVRGADSKAGILPYRLDAQLTGWMLKNQKPLLVNDLENDERFQLTRISDLHINSLLSVPLRLKGNLIGILNIFNKQRETGFTSSDQKLLSIIASQSAQAIENARLYEEEQDLIHMREEMRLAHSIQTKLMPKTAPEIAGYAIAGKNIPAKDVGGDYFDFIPMENSKLAFCLGDISGKGIPAALLMANLQATIRAQTLMEMPAQTCIEKSNILLFRSTDVNKFATFFYGILDPVNHRFCYCNAGHNPIFKFSTDGSYERLQTGGTVLGIVENLPYAEETIQFNKGDVLLLYSDGITEATNAADEDFDEPRLIELAQKNRDASPAEIIDKIINSVEKFSEGTPQDDDITVVVIKRLMD